MNEWHLWEHISWGFGPSPSALPLTHCLGLALRIATTPRPDQVGLMWIGNKTLHTLPGCPTPSLRHISEQGLGKCFQKDPDIWLPCLPASALLSLDYLFLLSQPVQLCSHWAEPRTNVTFCRMSFLSKLMLWLLSPWESSSSGCFYHWRHIHVSRQPLFLGVFCWIIFLFPCHIPKEILFSNEANSICQNLSLEKGVSSRQLCIACGTRHVHIKLFISCLLQKRI